MIMNKQSKATVIQSYSFQDIIKICIKVSHITANKEEDSKIEKKRKCVCYYIPDLWACGRQPNNVVYIIGDGVVQASC